MKGRDRLCEFTRLLGPALPFAQYAECIAQVVLGCSPILGNWSRVRTVRASRKVSMRFVELPDSLGPA